MSGNTGGHQWRGDGGGVTVGRRRALPGGGHSPGVVDGAVLARVAVAFLAGGIIAVEDRWKADAHVVKELLDQEVVPAEVRHILQIDRPSE